MNFLVRRPKTPLVVVAALALVISGCTTVTRTSLTSGAGAAGGPAGGSGGASAAGAAPGSASVGPGGVTSGGGPGAASGSGAGSSGGAFAGSSAGGSASGAQAAGAGGSASSGAGGARTASAGTGACKQIVKVGATYSSDEGEVLAALGNPAAGAETGGQNYVQQAQAFYNHLADWVNANGGLDGCQMQFVFYDFKFADPNGESDNSENECVSFAEDQHTFAVMNAENENKTLITCLAQHHVLILYGGGLQYRPVPADFLAYRGYLYQPYLMNIYRLGPAISIWNQAGYFGPNPASTKVGILLADDGTGSNQYLVNNLWKPALARIGITNPVVYSAFQCTTVSNCSTTTDEYNNAILQFRAAGVDHVIYTPDGGDAAFFFTQVAHSQDYHPRYAMTSYSAPSLWPTEPSDQRPDAVAMSFYTIDLYPDAAGELAGEPMNAHKAICNQMLQKYYPSTYPVYYTSCDEVLFLYTALKGAPSVTPQSVLAAVDRFGNSFELAGGYGNAYFGPPDHYDGATTVRAIEWSEPQQKWNYVSGPIIIPEGP